MFSHRLILRKIAHVHGQGDETYAANCVLAYLSRFPEAKHLNLEFVRQLAASRGRNLVDRPILRALQFLAGDTAAKLELRFEIQLDDDEFEDITLEQAKAAIEENIDPLTGTFDDAITERILIYYRPRITQCHRDSDT